MKRSADFYGDIKLKEQYPGLEVVGREKVGEKDAIVLASQASPSRIEKLYFDAQTGLLIRFQTITQTPIGAVPDQFDFEDFRDVDGVKIPFIVRHSPVEARDGWSRKYTEIKQNVPVESPVEAALCEKFLVRALLADFAVMEDDDAVCALDRGEAMRDD